MKRLALALLVAVLSSFYLIVVALGYTSGGHDQDWGEVRQLDHYRVELVHPAQSWIAMGARAGDVLDLRDLTATQRVMWF